MTNRNTKTKIIVKNLFQQSSTPLSLKEVFVYVHEKFPTTAYSTVYRIVQNLYKKELLVRVDMRERGSCFEWSKRAHHHHLHCDGCGKITDIDDTLLGFSPTKLTQKTGFLIKAHSIEITGICEPCQTTTKEGATV